MPTQLRARYCEWLPWAMDVKKGNTTHLDGVLKDVFEALEQSLRYNFLIGSQIDHQFGSLQKNGTYSGMLGALYRNEVDIGGPFGVSEQRAAVVDFTNCLEIYRLGIITGIVSSDRNMFLYIKVFSWQVWLLIFGALFCVSLVAMLIYNVIMDGWKMKQVHLLMRYLWVFGSYLVGHDCGTTKHWALVNIWHRHSFRILTSTWLLGPVLIILYTFQGTITSTFAITKLRPVISDLEDLGRRKSVIPVTSRGSAVQICFMTSPEPLQAQLWQRMVNNSIEFSPARVEETLNKVEKGTHVLIIDYVYALNIVTERVKRTKRCSIQVQQTSYCSGFIALASRKGLRSKTRTLINRKLTEIVQAKLTDRWLNRVYENYTHCSRQPSDVFKPLNITDILGAFVLWSIGVTMALSFFAAELLTAKIQNEQQVSDTQQQQEAPSKHRPFKKRISLDGPIIDIEPPHIMHSASA